MSKPLCELCTLSIKLGSIPDSCKNEKLNPFFKKESINNLSNYRPILLLYLISKFIEKRIMNKQVDFYLKTRTSENHSTNSCLTFSHNKILKVMNKGLMASMILIPLQKVFDTIDHYIILLKNMSTIGFSKYTIGWFKSFVLSKFRKLIQNLQILRVDTILVHSGTFTVSHICK